MVQKLSICLKKTPVNISTLLVCNYYHFFLQISYFLEIKHPFSANISVSEREFFLHKCHSCHFWQIPCLIGYLTKWLHPLILTFHISSILQRRYARDIWNCNFNIEEFFILVWLKSNWIMSLPSTPVFSSNYLWTIR